MDAAVTMPPGFTEGDVDDLIHDPSTDTRRLERAMHLYRRDSEAQLDAQQRQITELTEGNAMARQELDALLASTMATKRSKRAERYEDTGADRERTYKYGCASGSRSKLELGAGEAAPLRRLASCFIEVSSAARSRA
jgi:hypothetical protein